MIMLCMSTLGAGAVSPGHIATLALWQAQDSINSGNSKLLMFFVGLVAICILVQAVVVVGLGVGAWMAKNAIMAQVADLKAKAMPLINKAHGLVEDLTPEIKQITAKVNEITGKVHEITAHVEEIAGVAKDKVNEFAPTISAANVTFGEANQTVKDANQKTRQQIDRVNGMISSTLDATSKLGKAIQGGISKPGRELAGMVSGAKATLDSFLHRRGGPVSNSAKGPRPVWPGSPKTQTPPSGTPVRPFTSSGAPDVAAEVNAAAVTAVLPSGEPSSILGQGPS